MPDRPVHLAVPGTNRTLCGLGDRRGPAVPYRSAVAVASRAAVCRDCRDALDALDDAAD